MGTTALASGTGLRSDVEIARQVLAHIDAGTTDEGEGWREPVANYLDPARFAAELAVLRSMPSVLCPSAAVAGPGDHLPRTVYGVPLFAVRDRDGVVRVFRNACRHRGVPLVGDAGCARALTCPYHGWTYRLDGTLAHIPHADAFPDVGRPGLVEVPSDEVDGLVVIAALDGSSAGSAPSAPPAREPVWHGVLPAAPAAVTVTSSPRPMNWKVLVEQFLEGYHIRSTHRETFFPLQYDDLNVIETVGRDVRITYPYRNIERLRDRPQSDWSIIERVTFVHHVFPNTMVATFPDQVLVITVDPVDIGHSVLTTTTLARTGQRAVATPRRRTDPDEVPLLARGVLEDDAMSRGVQQGLSAGANTALEFGRHESAIAHFHRNLTGLLGDAAGAGTH